MQKLLLLLNELTFIASNQSLSTFICKVPLIFEKVNLHCDFKFCNNETQHILRSGIEFTEHTGNKSIKVDLLQPKTEIESLHQKLHKKDVLPTHQTTV